LDQKKQINPIPKENQKKNNKSKYFDIEEIFAKIAPYLADPIFIKKFLKKHSSKSRYEIINKIENDLKKYKQIKQTDLRILLNAI